ncbi:Hypothetical protein Deide_1p00915 (plasmid) [Deinococcus deserti VCD115]|uniref:Uncharacterized protein n=1 Tax=Deinococcus deserti (strain DSM 17065 / CIP 109153 / LMG 22923 / VCD115) TaxID=546414 RepID=C1D262_DEIDV|nr:Hypothetical protein Deide_1p00915 [Deinococcus deserti VCD115]
MLHPSAEKAVLLPEGFACALFTVAASGEAKRQNMGSLPVMMNGTDTPSQGMKHTLINVWPSYAYEAVPNTWARVYQEIKSSSKNGSRLFLRCSLTEFLIAQRHLYAIEAESSREAGARRLLYKSRGNKVSL